MCALLVVAALAPASCPPLPPAAVVLVTGASSGIGAELALQLGARGAHLVLAARRVHELSVVADAARAAGAASVRYYPTDMSNATAVAALVAAAALDGRLDVLLLNHATVDEGLLDAYESPEALAAALALPLMTNAVGSAVAAVAGLGSLERGSYGGGAGHIALVSSASAIVAAPFRGGYVASKAALGGLGRVLSAELHLAHSRVTVGVLVLGMVATEKVRREQVLQQRVGGPLSLLVLARTLASHR